MKLNRKFKKMAGFTLLEILIALFIFSILSIMLAAGLRTVIDAQSGTEKKAEQLRDTQLALLVLSRDLEQAINRPVMTGDSNKQEQPFLGEAGMLTLTHTGYANPTATAVTSSLQRTRYFVEKNALIRMTWEALDRLPKTVSHRRGLLNGVSKVQFEYLDYHGTFQKNWPGEGDNQVPLPRAVRVTLTIDNWGTLTQLYVLPMQNIQAQQPQQGQQQQQSAQSPAKPES